MKDQVWLPEAEHRPSSNRNQRPDGTNIDLLVIHNISLPPGEFGGPWIDDLFLNQLDPSAHPSFVDLAGLEVSSHLLICRDGSLIQYVPLNLRAWHAGFSHFDGRNNCNDFSIGIELEGTDQQPFEDSQYQTLVRATRRIMAIYPAITAKRITGHSDIAPGRKTDPGPFFDWRRYLDTLGSL